MKINIPSHICFRVTRRCNLLCSFCLASNKYENLTLEEIKESISILKNNGLKNIRLSGGEPTVRKDLIHIIDHCTKLNLNTILCSNLYNIDSIYDDLITYPIIIKTSIHGDEKLHNSITGINSYKFTIKNIQRLVKDNIEVDIHNVLTEPNYLKLENLINHSINLGVKKISFISLIPRERGDTFLNGKNPPKMKIELDKLRKKYSQLINIKFKDFYNKHYYVFEPDGNLYLEKENEKHDKLICKII